MPSSSVTIEFEKAVAKLETAAARPKDEFMRDSTIQRFEFSIELAWKTAKRVMGTSAQAPKDVIREMAQAGYIQDPALWLEAIDMRNLTSHTYKEELAERVYGFALRFLPELKSLADFLSHK